MGFLFSSAISCKISQTVQYIPYFSTVLERASLVVLLIGWLFVGCLCLGGGLPGVFFSSVIFCRISQTVQYVPLFFTVLESACSIDFFIALTVLLAARLG